MPRLDLHVLRQWDAEDPLRAARARFDLPPDTVYLDGNSLGALPHATKRRVAEVVAQEWGQGLIRSWNHCEWIGAPRRVGDKIARLIGAAPGEVIAADSTSVNLYKLINVALDARPGRREILTESGNFPTDVYVMEGAARGRQGVDEGAFFLWVQGHGVLECLAGGSGYRVGGSFLPCF